MPKTVKSLDASVSESVTASTAAGMRELLFRLLSGGFIALSEDRREDSDDGLEGNSLESSLLDLRMLSLSSGASFGWAGTLAGVCMVSGRIE